jgi:arabinogalactan oligomer/maltooligosaccharide transport system substrate-binding protein
MRNGLWMPSLQEALIGPHTEKTQNLRRIAKQIGIMEETGPTLMNRRRMQVVWLLFALVILTSCQSNFSDDELNGRITLWHSWSGAEAVMLSEGLAQFQEIHPDVRIVTVALPEDQVLEEFNRAGHNGLGPGILIGSDSWIGELGNTGLIRSLSADEAPSALLDERNASLARYQGQLFGVPLFLAPRALYYNKSLVAEPPGSLDELLQEAAAGNRIAFVPRFEEAYWGIQAFGEGLFDDQDRFTLAESGFKEWLTWLVEAQDAPGVILNVDDESLLELFASGEIAYYVAGPQRLARISALMGEEDSSDIGVAPLPAGPHGPAGPLLPAETVLFYAFTSPEQARIANALADFLANQQQGVHFMRELDKVPANPRVRVDRRIYPIVNGFAQQAKTAVVIPNEMPSDLLVAAGNRAYVGVGSGTLTPAEAVCRFGQEVANLQGYAAEDMSLPEGCELRKVETSQGDPAAAIAHRLVNPGRNP